MTQTATLHAHPSDPDILVLKTPHELASEMGRAAFARYDADMRAYLLHIDHLDALRKFAKMVNLYLIDQRQAPPGEQTRAPECKHCGQPAALMSQPNRCPACGKPWDPVFVGSDNPLSPLKKACVRCDHRQLRSFAYCSQCGEVMPPDEDVLVRRLPIPRTNLADPMPLSDAVREVVPDLDGPTGSEWAELVKLEIRPRKAPDRQAEKARASVDVRLPESEAL